MVKNSFVGSSGRDSSTGSEQTISVLALDGADYRLLKKYNCANILMDNHDRLETYNYSMEGPSTPEVWATVATGLGPEEHGVTISTSQTWENPLLRIASNFTGILPWSLRRKLGAVFRDRGQEQTLKSTEVDHVFEQGAVYTWPGISKAENLLDAWRLMEQLNHKDLDSDAWRRSILGNFGKELGWLRMQAVIGTPIAGVHSHILDATGHTYCEREEKLREYYEFVDERIGTLQEETDHLLILSDHGMKVSWLDEETGTHSWEAVVSSSEQGTLPDSVYDVRSWLEARIPEPTTRSREEQMDIDKGTLQDLGYMR